MLGWPENPFWNRHRKVLHNALAMALGDWKRGNATGNARADYAGYRHLVHAIAIALRRRLDVPAFDRIMRDLLAAEPRLSLSS